MFAALAKGLPMLAGGLGGGGSTKVSNSVSSSVGAAVNPAITIGIGGDVRGDSNGDAGSDATARALALGTEIPDGLGSLGLGAGLPMSDPVYYETPDVTGGSVDFGQGDLLSNPLVWLAGAAAVGFLLLNRG